MTSPNQNFVFSQEQILIADGYKSSGDLPGMYRYLSQQVAAQLRITRPATEVRRYSVKLIVTRKVDVCT